MLVNFLKILFVVVILSVNYRKVDALKCYACTVTVADIDQRCVTNPDQVESGQKIVNCNKEYCTSKRVEFKDPVNKVHSMARGCESNPERMNTIEEDDTFITYYRACRRDLCNGGNGKGGDGNGGDFNNDPGSTGVLLVPGIGAANKSIHSSIGLVIFGCLIFGVLGGRNFY